jgi:hypothetical protein
MGDPDWRPAVEPTGWFPRISQKSAFLLPAYKKASSRAAAIDQILDVRYVPASAASGLDTTVIQSRSQPAQIADA